MTYTAILEKGESSYGACVPDLPGCVAVGESREETLALLKEAVDPYRRAAGGWGAAAAPELRLRANRGR